MRLLLRACFGSIDMRGNLQARDILDDDCEYLAEVLDGLEIDRVRFDVSMDGKDLLITMAGEGLSGLVSVNYKKGARTVSQIAHKSPEAKLTSSILNKFLRRTNKLLSQEPCNRGKEQQPNVILIKEIEEKGDRPQI